MKRYAVAACLVVLVAGFAWAGSPHFVGTPDLLCSDSSIMVSGKLAGLGDEDQVHVVVSAFAQCLNPGGNFPSADNKDEVTAEGDFPVQNGKALFSLVVDAEFQPECSPPMSVVWTDVLVEDTTHGLSVFLGDCP